MKVLTLFLLFFVHAFSIEYLPIHEAYVSRFTDAIIPQLLIKEPPAALKETIPEQPSSDLTWIPGYWSWQDEKKEYVWICGIWRRPPLKHHWISGFWHHNENQWQWAKGFWSTRKEDQLLSTEKAPPSSIEEKIPSSPGDNFFWAQGFWAYFPKEKDFRWVSGKWEQFNENWLYCPAQYIWRPSGYIFEPLHWDWPLDARGFVYQCESKNEVKPIPIEPKKIVHHLYCYYPDFINVFWHTWHYHPGWWDGCYCIPPWWYSPEWWTLTWLHTWECFWWWKHPDSLPPKWLSEKIAKEIPPPSKDILNACNTIGKPFTPENLAEKILLPSGKHIKTNMPKPHFIENRGATKSIQLPLIPLNIGKQLVPIQKKKQITTYEPFEVHSNSN